jgi:CBS domain-containing protein
MAAGIVKKSLEELGASSKAREIRRVVRSLLRRRPAEEADSEGMLLGGIVRDIMSRPVACCSTVDTLQRAAQIMWERDCGCVPVVDADGRAVGVVTDRDLCMASYTQGRGLSTIAISGVLSGRAHVCTPLDPIDTAIGLMRSRRVRRLLVVDPQQRLIGIIALADIARYVSRIVAAQPKAALVLSSLVASLSERRTGAGPAERAAE